MARTNYLKTNLSFMQQIFALEGCQMNYAKYLDLINYGKQTTVFTETLVHALNITFYDY